jgi:hypothetical protein
MEEMTGCMIGGMGHHLDKAKMALARNARSGKSTGPTTGDLGEAVKEIIAHLEDLEGPPARKQRVVTHTVDSLPTK